MKNKTIGEKYLELRNKATHPQVAFSSRKETLSINQESYKNEGV